MPLFERQLYEHAVPLRDTAQRQSAPVLRCEQPVEIDALARRIEERDVGLR